MKFIVETISKTNKILAIAIFADEDKACKYAKKLASKGETIKVQVRTGNIIFA